MTKIKPTYWALAFLVCVSLVSILKPPVPHTSVTTFQHPDGIQLKTVLKAKITLQHCKDVSERIKNHFLKSCPECRVMDSICLTVPGNAIRLIQSNDAIGQYSIRFRNGDIVFSANSTLESKAVCLASQLQGAGRCYEPGEKRTTHDESGSNTLFSVKAIQGDELTLAVLAAGFLTFTLAIAIVLTQGLHGRFSYDSRQGVQRFHEANTPRIGGIPLIAGFALAAWLMIPAETGANVELIWPALIAVIPAFVFGLAEDFTKRVGIAPRMIATMASTVIAWWLTGISLTSVDIPMLDVWLTLMVLSVIFSAVAVSGVANSINIIDGFHGLASGVALIILMSFAILSSMVGDLQLAVFALMLAGATAGFFFVNYPLGKIFLGDGGAYLLGFFIGWIAILLPMRNPEVSSWASLLICAYPVTETIFSVYRRIRNKFHVADPDRNHLHSLIKTTVIAQKFSGLSLDRRNALVAPLLWVFAAIPAGIALTEFSSTPALVLALFIFSACYVLVYNYFSRISRKTAVTAV